MYFSLKKIFVLDSIHTSWTIQCLVCEPCCLNLTVDRTAEVLIDPNSFSRCKQRQHKKKNCLKWPGVPLISLDGTEISIWELTTKSKKVSFLKGYFMSGFLVLYHVKNYCSV